MKWGLKGAVILSILLVSVMFTIINLTVPEGNLHSVLNGLATGITVLVVNFLPAILKKDKTIGNGIFWI